MIDWTILILLDQLMVLEVTDMSFNRTMLVVALVMLCSFPSAKSEEIWDGIRVTCLPQQSYFSVDTLPIALNNADQTRFDAEHKPYESKQASGVEYALRYDDKTSACTLGSTIFRAVVTDYRPPHDVGECAEIENFRISILENNISIYSFPAFGLDRCMNEERHSVFIDGFGYLTDCTMSLTVSSCNRIHYP